MRILSVKKYKGSTYEIIIEGMQNVYVGEATVLEFSLKKNLDLTQNILDEILLFDLKRKAKQRALYLLDVRDYSSFQMIQKLRRTYPLEVAKETAEFLLNANILDDERYARKFARYLFEVKKVGLYKAKQELRKAGISSEISCVVLEDFSEKEDSFERLTELVEKKYERYLVDEKGVKKVRSALARAGYSYSEIKDVLNLYDLDF